MQINEEIEEARSIEELKEKEKALKEEMKTLISSIEKHFEKEGYTEIADELIKVRFCKRTLEQIDNKERELA